MMYQGNLFQALYYAVIMKIIRIKIEQEATVFAHTIRIPCVRCAELSKAWISMGWFLLQCPPNNHNSANDQCATLILGELK